jgi:hypothetical protein
VDEGVEMEEGELLADYKGRLVEHEAYQRLLKENAEARAKLDAYKEPARALTPEQRREIARQELRAFQQAEREAALPPEAREQLARDRAREAELAAREEAIAKREAADKQAKAQANREYTTHVYRATMKILGVPDDRDGIVSQQVLALMYEAKRDGKEYPPETLAHRVRQRMQGASASWVATGGAKGLLSNPKVVEILNNLNPEEHGALLEALGPFMETARAYNLQRRGLTAVPGGHPQGQPVITAPTASTTGSEPRTTQAWIAHFKGGAQPSTPAQREMYWSLKDRGLL